jgi:hypothetical protein
MIWHENYYKGLSLLVVIIIKVILKRRYPILLALISFKIQNDKEEGTEYLVLQLSISELSYMLHYVVECN